MIDNELVDSLNVIADTIPQITALYNLLAETDLKSISYEEIVTMIQAAFWTGVEAGSAPKYQDFRDEVNRVQK